MRKNELGARAVSIYSCSGEALHDGLGENEVEWVRHAVGVLITEEGRSGEEGSGGQASRLRAQELGAAWPPIGAEVVDVDELYDGLVGRGVKHGPAFQGACGVWRRDGEVFVEAKLPAGVEEQASSFGLHPALLDAAFQAIEAGMAGDRDDAGNGTESPDGAWLPFSWEEVRLFASGVSRLRASLSLRVEQGRVSASLVAADEQGELVATVGSLVLREISAAQLSSRHGRARESLFCLEWAAVGGLTATTGVSAKTEVLGTEDGRLVSALRASGREVVVHRDLASLRETVDGGAVRPSVVLVDCLLDETLVAGGQKPFDAASRGGVQAGGPSASLADGGGCEHKAGSGSDEAAEMVRREAHRALELVQDWLEDERFVGSRMVFVTQSAVATYAGEAVEGLPAAAVWGLVRSAQSESPGRIVLMDVDGKQESYAAACAALVGDEPQVAVREGEVLAPRLVRAGSDGALTPPGTGTGWRLDVTAAGTLENLVLIENDEGLRALAPGEVRVAVRAAGLNFRDVLIALDMYPGDALIGAEGAGVVVDVGTGVEGLTRGDRVMGMLSSGCGPLAIADQRMVAPMPDGWSFEQAASTPIVFLTAFYALLDLAQVGRGERAAGTRCDRRRWHGRCATRPPLGGRGICDRQPRQVADARVDGL